MKGFKNSTRTQYMKGGSCEGYAKGGSVKGAAKIAKVMGEFKAGTLHSGSKKGPEVTSRKQATAIALSEARKAGAKIGQPVQKKLLGGLMRKKQAADAAEAANFSNLSEGFRNVFGEDEDGMFNLASNRRENGLKKGGKVVKKDVGGTVTNPRQGRVDTRAADQAARAEARNTRTQGRDAYQAERLTARADRMAARDAHHDARMDARDAQREAAQARQASLRETLSAAMPTRGPGGAGFNARPAIAPREPGTPTRQPVNVSTPMVARNPATRGLKKGGLSAMPKGKSGKC